MVNFTVYFKNIDTQEEIKPSITMSGNPGQTYHIEKPVFDIYRLVEQNALLDGVYESDDRDITLYFRRRDWLEGQRINFKIQLFEPTTVYSDTNLEARDGQLDTGNEHIVNMRVVTPDGSFWYRTNNNKWLHFNATTMELLDPDEDSIIKIDTENTTNLTNNIDSQSQAVSIEDDEPIEIIDDKAISEPKLESNSITLSPENTTNISSTNIKTTNSDSINIDFADGKSSQVEDTKKTTPTTATDQESNSKSKTNVARPEKFNAQIDFVPRRKTAIFDEPNGTMTGQIKHDAHVKVIGRLDHDELTWYELEDLGWITELYIKTLVFLF